MILCFARRVSEAILTDIVVKPKEGAAELSVALHDNPDARSDALVDQLQRENGGEGRGCGSRACGCRFSWRSHLNRNGRAKEGIECRNEGRVLFEG